jgi:hypothetical protein
VDDPDPVLREHAQWAARRLGERGATRAPGAAPVRAP